MVFLPVVQLVTYLSVPLRLSADLSVRLSADLSAPDSVFTEPISPGGRRGIPWGSKNCMTWSSLVLVVDAHPSLYLWPKS